ncbi:hypothetical protein AVEN_205042-1 [Araneus ventricosus]|uniref:Uncharacterized protein n=1 Tax=Araneus ventricosus TaxID=182803 RepID=A0A4Y2DCQ9_ARAVE|nr:hypothetical protein AVEN_192353-1 [Araneus ventricosus]GBM13876.1 hypothetical protein AVEN_205042-1 [Araneus ventricosus]
MHNLFTPVHVSEPKDRMHNLLTPVHVSELKDRVRNLIIPVHVSESVIVAADDSARTANLPATAKVDTTTATRTGSAIRGVKLDGQVSLAKPNPLLEDSSLSILRKVGQTDPPLTTDTPSHYVAA